MPVFFLQSILCVKECGAHFYACSHVCNCMSFSVYMCAFRSKVDGVILLSLSPSGALRQCHSLKPLFRLVYEPTSSCCLNGFLVTASQEVELILAWLPTWHLPNLNSESKNCAASIFTYYCTYPALQPTILKWKLRLDYFESCYEENL